MDLQNTFGEIIFSAPVKTIAELVSKAIEEKANLSLVNGSKSLYKNLAVIPNWVFHTLPLWVYVKNQVHQNYQC